MLWPMSLAMVSSDKDGSRGRTRVNDSGPDDAAKRTRLSSVDDDESGPTCSTTGSGEAATGFDTHDYQTTNILNHIQGSMMKSLWGSVAGKPLHTRIDDKGFLDAFPNPVYLGLIRYKLLKCKYNNSDEYLNDVRTMLDNILNYYRPDTALHVAADKLDNLFKKKMRELPNEEEKKQKPLWNPRNFSHLRALLHDPSIVATFDSNNNNNNNSKSSHSSSSVPASSHATTTHLSATSVHPSTSQQTDSLPPQTVPTSVGNRVPVPFLPFPSTITSSQASGSGASSSSDQQAPGAARSAAPVELPVFDDFTFSTSKPIILPRHADHPVDRSASEGSSSVLFCMKSTHTSTMNPSAFQTSSAAVDMKKLASSGALATVSSNTASLSSAASSSGSWLAVSSGQPSFSVPSFRVRTPTDLLGSNGLTLSMATSSGVDRSSHVASCSSSTSKSSLFQNVAAKSSSASEMSSGLNAGSSHSSSVSGDLVLMDVDDDDGLRKAWSCPDCTFLNHPEIPECECCGRKINIVVLSAVDQVHKSSGDVSNKMDCVDLCTPPNSATSYKPEQQKKGGNTEVIDLLSPVDVTCGAESAISNPVKESVSEQSILEPEWSCLRCTMLNHPLLLCCECCGLERYSDVTAVAEDKPLWKSLPPSWSAPQPGVQCRKIDLSKTDPEYIEVAQNAQRTAQKCIREIVGIQRIENAKLYTLYNVSRTTMNDCNGRGSENENLLWHGTSPETVDIICNRGFNRSYCGKNATAFGKGVYFARDFLYSANLIFSPPDKYKNRYIFQCRVLTGEYTAGRPNYIEPPVKDKKTLALYDSVVDNVKMPSIFVIFHDAQVYPEYLVSFRG